MQLFTAQLTETRMLGVQKLDRSLTKPSVLDLLAGCYWVMLVETRVLPKQDLVAGRTARSMTSFSASHIDRSRCNSRSTCSS